MDIRYVIVAMVCAAGLYFVLDGIRQGGDKTHAAVPAQFEPACAADPAMCACVAPLLHFIDENEELSELVAGTPARLGRTPTIREWAAEWMNDQLPGAWHWVQVSQQRLNTRWILDCMTREEIAGRRAAGLPDLPTFEEAAGGLEDHR